LAIKHRPRFFFAIAYPSRQAQKSRPILISGKMCVGKKFLGKPYLIIFAKNLFGKNSYIAH